ncbi:hypothetical protein MYVA_0115 [Mycolicibacterium vaccae 95051]|nr:hypothetical protein MYVA_0115 [Mycolicibacterium vaccae 95051]
MSQCCADPAFSANAPTASRCRETGCGLRAASMLARVPCG